MNSTDSYQPVTLLVVVFLATGLFAVLGWVLFSLPVHTTGLSELVRNHLPESGVSAEVTAVLLNFRGYDTLLEVSVLLAALLGTWHLGVLHLSPHQSQSSPIMDALLPLLVPVIILVSGYILWLGGHAAGGAFQAGALLAAAGILVFVVHPEALALRDKYRLRIILITGPFVFTLVAAIMLLLNGNILEYTKDQAGLLILLIESASTLSIGLTLTLLFAGGRPHHGDRQ